MEEIVYVLAADGTGKVELLKVKEDDLEELLDDLAGDGKIFIEVVSPKVENNELHLVAKEYKKGEYERELRN